MDGWAGESMDRWTGESVDRWSGEVSGGYETGERWNGCTAQTDRPVNRWPVEKSTGGNGCSVEIDDGESVTVIPVTTATVACLDPLSHEITPKKVGKGFARFNFQSSITICMNKHYRKSPTIFNSEIRAG